MMLRKTPKAGVDVGMQLLSQMPLGRRFVAKRLKRAAVVWLNSAWFDECGIGNLTTASYEHRSHWLLSNFAFAVPSSSDNGEGAYGQDEKVFFADSYGETGKVFHGGSARAGAADGFQIKGIGVTPLLGVYADPLHSHGSAWFEEGVREAIYSEIYRRELPWSAVPVVALIDTGIHSRGDRGSLERRVLIVRPFVLRPAHAQRALMFRPVDGVRSAQMADAARTRLIIELLQTSPAAIGVPVKDNSFDPILLLHRIADQIAYCEANRLTHGGFLASNLAFDGRTLDFGAARSLPSWGYVSLLPGLPGFGRDSEVVVEFIESFSFYLRKYSPTLYVSSSSELIDSFLRYMKDARKREFLRLWGPNVLNFSVGVQKAIYTKTMAIFGNYQKSHVSVQSLNDVDPRWQKSVTGLVSEVERILPSVGDAHDFNEPSHSVTDHFRRATVTRSELFREALQERIFHAICPMSCHDVVHPERVRQFIEAIVNNNVLRLDPMPDAMSRTWSGWG